MTNSQGSTNYFNGQKKVVEGNEQNNNREYSPTLIKEMHIKAPLKDNQQDKDTNQTEKYLKVC